MTTDTLLDEIPATFASETPPPSLGMGFYPTADCSVTKLRWYHPQEEGGSTGHDVVLKLWSSDSLSAGTELASGTIASADLTLGWHEVDVSPPVAITTGAPYKVSGHSRLNYSATGARFAAADVPSPGGLLVAYKDGTNPTGLGPQGNGTFRSGTFGVYPSDAAGGFNATWYGLGVTVTTVDGPEEHEGAGALGIELELSASGHKVASGAAVIALALAGPDPEGSKSGRGSAALGLSLVATSHGTKHAAGAAAIRMAMRLLTAHIRLRPGRNVPAGRVVRMVASGRPTSTLTASGE